MGDAVNLASRLEGITKEYGADIIVGEDTKNAVPDVVFREIDRVRVKGKDTAVAIYEPLGLDGEVPKAVARRRRPVSRGARALPETGMGHGRAATAPTEDDLARRPPLRHVSRAHRVTARAIPRRRAGTAPSPSKANKMKLRILGCSGGIGGDLRTTSMLLDDDVLIDAGTGVGDLSVAALTRIDHIFVTHSHMDHVTSIPFLVDTVGLDARQARSRCTRRARRSRSCTSTCSTGSCGPISRRSPIRREPMLRYQAIEVGQPVRLGERKITALPANHVVPGGRATRSIRAAASLVFSGDTTTNDALWEYVNAHRQPALPRSSRPRSRTGSASSRSRPSTCARACSPTSWRRLTRHARRLHHAPEAARSRAHHGGDLRARGRAPAADARRTTRFSSCERQPSRCAAPHRVSA